MNPQTGSRSTAPFASRRRPISRRRFLRGSAVALALPFLDSMRRAVRAGGRRRRPGAAADVLHLQQPRPAARAVLPQGRGPRLHALAVPEAAQGAPRRLHRAQRRVAPERGRRPPVGHQLPDRGPAPGQQLVPQHDLARPVRGRADRHADAVPVAHAGGQRRPQPVVDAHRRRDPAGGPGVRRVQPALPAGHARRGRARRSASSTPGGASWTRSPSRPRTCSATSAPATAAGSTSISPASATWSTGSRSRAAGPTSPSRRSRPARRSTRPARRSTWTRCRSCTTWRGWPSRPTRPARSR